MFTHLHVHTEYSLLDGLSRLDPLVQKASELGMGSLAITDHGGLYGAIDFYRAAKEAGIKPIIGCEMYVAPGSRHSKSPADKTPYHITVLSKDMQGYRNLVKLVTASHLEGFYYKPRVDRELLERHHEGLIVLSGCPSGEVPQLISQDRMEEAKDTAAWYRDLFGDYYLELMEHGGVPELPAVNKGLMELHRDLGIPVVATNDAHYINRQDAPLQDVLICIHTNTNVQDEGRLRMTEDSYYLKSPEEMRELFADLPEAVANTQAIAEMCNLELDFSQLHMPQYEVPNGQTADEHLTGLCREGFNVRLPDAGPKEMERLNYELDVIRQTRFANYLLVVSDIARFARESDILLAVRGSAAGSLALYCLGVTDVNPVHYNILSERFLNVERPQMPDIDMDFQDDRRQEVFDYVVSKYGRDRVAQIITFGTLGAKAAIRDVGRALAMPYADVDSIARLVPYRLNMTLDQAMEESPELKEVYGADDAIKRLVDTARSLEGTARHSSTHAAGLVISDEPLDSYVPLQMPTKGDDDSISMTQYAMEPVEALGLLKMDILGLANLTILSKALELIGQTRDIDITIDGIPLDDSKTYEMLSRGETVGVFQLEGTGMTRNIKELKPSAVADVAAMIALYRPGPMEHIGTFVEAKHGRAEPRAPHPALKEILEGTYGVIVYQDQVLLIAQAFAGYSLGEADVMRKAMGKKIPEIMAQEREGFIQGALGQGYQKSLAEEVFALIEPFAGYAFGKAHAVSYGLISYWTAYLKANYPEEYMVSLLNAYPGNTEKLSASIQECRRLKIPVLDPDIIRSAIDFAIERDGESRNGIRVGLAAIKNVGATAVQPVVEAIARESAIGSLEQLCRVADMSGLNSKTLESLIKAGAFDRFGSRAGLLGSVGRILSLAQSEARLRDSNQTSMFDLFGESVPTPLAHIEIPDEETQPADRRAWEMEVLGVDLSGGDQLQQIALGADPDAIVSRDQIVPEMAGKKIVLLGQVSDVTHRVTKDNRPYALAPLALMDGSIDVFIWDEQLQATRELWKGGTLVTIEGTVRARRDQLSISCLSATPHIPRMEADDERARDEEPTSAVALGGETADLGRTAVGPSPQQATWNGDGAKGAEKARSAKAGMGAGSRLLTLRIRETDQPNDDRLLLDEVKQVLLEHQGEDAVRLEIASNGSVVTLDWPLVRVNVCPQLEDGLRRVLGLSGEITVGIETH